MSFEVRDRRGIHSEEGVTPVHLQAQGLYMTLLQETSVTYFRFVAEKDTASSGNMDDKKKPPSV